MAIHESSIKVKNKLKVKEKAKTKTKMKKRVNGKDEDDSMMNIESSSNVTIEHQGDKQLSGDELPDEDNLG